MIVFTSSYDDKKTLQAYKDDCILWSSCPNRYELLTTHGSFAFT
eukprot:UN19981